MKMHRVNSAFLLNKKVFISVDEGVDSSRLAVKAGSVSIPFEPAFGDEIGEYFASQRLKFDMTDLAEQTTSEPVEDVPGEVYVCWVNHLTDWMLSGGQTIQLQIERRAEPCRIWFNNRLEVDAIPHGTTFKAFIATHRADAAFHILVEDIETGRSHTCTFEFDKAFSGGQLESGYKAVEYQMPRLENGARISFSVEFKAKFDDGSEFLPYLFIAEPRLSPGGAKSVLTPRPLLDGNVSVGSTWLAAPLPNMITPSTHIELILDKEKVPLVIGRDLNVELVENHGFQIVVSASEICNAVLAIDGKIVTDVTISPNLLIRFPAQYLTGAHRHICLKDETGSQILWETVTLLPSILTPVDVMQRESPPPFPSTLFPQTAHRYDSLKRQMQDAGRDVDYGQIARALQALEGGYERVKPEPLAFPEVSEPKVSIVMPAHNNFEFTYLALCSLLVAYNAVSFEVIVVDDASTDETTKLENIVSGITV
ncbi:MAG: glycosyltransferase, partial [Rhodobacteraceae bacterium]|nr:glycosyltransferase [Paracoccaceae bacterium]